MKELSLNILDITENSVKAGATITEIYIDETDTSLTIKIVDDGCGMSEEMVASVTDPFCTTRTTRKVGLGLPLFKMAAEQTGGSLNITSKQAKNPDDSHGTTVTATFNKNHFDFTPLGNVIETVLTLIQGHPNTDFYFSHKKGDKEVSLDTRQMRQVLEGLPLNTYEVIKWTEDCLFEQYDGF